MDYRDKRLRSSVHIQTDTVSLVLDTGPDFRQQVLREDIQHLDAVLFTHAHRDHTAGLDDVRAFNFKQGITMPVYGTAEVLRQIKQDFAYIFGPDDYPGLPRISLVEIQNGSFHVRGFTVIPLPVLHYKLPVLGFRIGNFSYITDANHIPEQTLELLKGTEILVINALQREPHISHFNLKEALASVQAIEPAQAYFTHISHKLGLHQKVTDELPPHVHLAYDGLQLTL
jgi:phosphoribosyl 1,2-cyclic phosphate phosphodiesterase